MLPDTANLRSCYGLHCRGHMGVCIQRESKAKATYLPRMAAMHALTVSDFWLASMGAYSPCFE
jgi:hypothetical protein